MLIFTISGSMGDQVAGLPRLTLPPLKFPLTLAENFHTYPLWNILMWKHPMLCHTKTSRKRNITLLIHCSSGQNIELKKGIKQM